MTSPKVSGCEPTGKISNVVSPSSLSLLLFFRFSLSLRSPIFPFFCHYFLCPLSYFSSLPFVFFSHSLPSLPFPVFPVLSLPPLSRLPYFSVAGELRPSLGHIQQRCCLPSSVLLVPSCRVRPSATFWTTWTSHCHLP